MQHPPPATRTAEGYSRDDHNDKNGEDQFSELLQLSIVQQPSDLITTASNGEDGGVPGERFHPRVHVVSRQMEENLLFELGGRCDLTTQRHLVDWARDRVVFQSIDFSRLRSLTVFRRWESFFISESMKMLRVLDLENTERNISDSDLHKVVELQVPVPSGTHPDLLPTSFVGSPPDAGRQGHSIIILPRNICKLHKLQYVRAGSAAAVALPTPWYRPSRWRVGVKVSRKSIGKLTALHTLGVVNIDASGGNAMVQELRKLTQLRKLGVSGINRDNSKSFFAAILEYAHLFDKKSLQAPMDGVVLPWETIHSLKLYGLQDRLPYHGRPFPERAAKLTKLDLEMEKLEIENSKEHHNMKFLGKLPNLRNLRLHLSQSASTTTSLKFELKPCVFELPSFEKVKILDIACSSSTLLQLTFGSETMKSLELLKLDYCRLDAEKPPQLDHLPELKEVILIA